MAEREHKPYSYLKAKHGKDKAIRLCLEAIRRKHPPKRERIVIS